MDKRFFLYAICLLLFFFTTGGVLVAGGNKEAPEIQSEIPDLEIPEEETPSIFPFSLWKDDKAVITLQEMFDAMPEDIPAIAIVPSEISDGIQDSEAQDIINDLTEVFIRLELFRPFSVTEWLTESYTNEEQNIIALVKKIAYEQFAVKMIVTSSFRKINGKTILRLGFYDINDPLNPIYFMREFSDYEDWKQKLPDLIFEIKLRSDNPLEPFRTSSIFVRNFPTKLYLYSEIDSGEFEFTNISLLHVGNQDFRTGEDFIKDLLTYELYSMQMVGVIADDMIQYRTDIVKSPCEYSIDGEFRISKEFQILVFRIYKHNASGQATKLFEYHVPVDGVEVESIRQALRYTTKLVYDQILSENDLEKISYNNIDFSKYGDVLYFNNFYIGNPVQDGFCLPVGCHWFSVLKYNDKGKRVSGMINTANTAIFVSPLGGNVDLYDRKTARHIQALLSAEEE